MRAILIAMILAFAITACGKKAPLRPPEDPDDPNQTLMLTP